jgi:hypothetical protein
MYTKQRSLTGTTPTIPPLLPILPRIKEFDVRGMESFSKSEFSYKSNL